MKAADPRAVAPDGRTILYSVTHGRRSGTDVHEWYTIASDGTAQHKIVVPKTFAPVGFTRLPRELYGTLDVNDLPQLAVWTIGARKARVIAKVPGGISAVVPSSDGARFALIGDPQAPDPLDKTRIVVGNSQSALFVVGATGGTPQRWCPALENIDGLAWSPDNMRIAALSQSPKIGFHVVTGRIDLCTATAAFNVAKINNSVENEMPYPDTGLAWSDGGRELAFLSSTSDVATPDHLWTVPVSGGTPHDRTPAIHGSMLGLVGDVRGNIWITIANGVQTDVDRYAGGVLTTAFMKHDGFLGLPVAPKAASAPAALVMSVADAAHPTDVAVAHGTKLTQITHVSDDVLAHIALGRVIRHRWTTADGVALEAIVTFPADYNGKPGKFLVLPHGGPEFNDRLQLDAFSRIIAGHGFVVMQPEYRGSTGYGTAHMEAIYQHFGDTAFKDVDAATSEAIAQGWADPHRLAIFGWSAGGFMTAWTVTQTSRYRAAIEGAGITEWLSFIMSSDEEQTDYDARPLEAGPQPFLQYSAVMFAQKIATPLLILHGAADQRVPTYQGRELFVLLKERGKTTRMVTYPGSPHFPNLWEQRRDVFDETTHWLDRYDP